MPSLTLAGDFGHKFRLSHDSVVFLFLYRTPVLLVSETAARPSFAALNIYQLIAKNEKRLIIARSNEPVRFDRNYDRVSFERLAFPPAIPPYLGSLRAPKNP